MGRPHRRITVWQRPCNSHAGEIFLARCSRSRTLPHAVVHSVASATMMSMGIPRAVRAVQLCRLCLPSLSHEDEVGRLESLTPSSRLASHSRPLDTPVCALITPIERGPLTSSKRNEPVVLTVQRRTGGEREETQSAAPAVWALLRAPSKLARLGNVLAMVQRSAGYPLGSVSEQTGRIVAGWVAIAGQAPRNAIWDLDGRVIQAARDGSGWRHESLQPVRQRARAGGRDRRRRLLTTKTAHRWR